MESKNANEEALQESLYKHDAEATKIGDSFDNYGAKVNKAKEDHEAEGFDKPVFPHIIGGGTIGTKIGEEIGEEIQDDTSDASFIAKKQAGSQTHEDGLDLSSAYEEATPKTPIFDSAYDQIVPGDPYSSIDSAYDQTIPQTPIWETAEENLINIVVNNPGGNPAFTDEEPPEPPYEFEPPVLSPDFESPYGEFEEHLGANIPDLVEPPGPPTPPLQFGDTVNLHNALGAPLFDPATPGPTLDPSLFDSNLPGATLDPSLFDLSAPGPTLDPALLDPNSPGPTFHPNLFDPSSSGESIDPALLDPSAPGPTLDPAQLEHGIVESSGIAEPAGFTNPSLMDAPALTDPGTTGKDDHEHDDFFEGGV
jgi:hypothetical protein